MTMEAGISGFHKIGITRNKNLKVLHYSNYKTFNTNLFKEEQNNELMSTDNNNAELEEFINNVL